MPENSHEPDNYSIDDMLDRLKRRPVEGGEPRGELVTRADGTQAIRVRKRKRRSHQPHKDEQARSRRMLMIQVSGAFLLVVLLGLTAGGAMVFGNSPMYRNRLLAGAQALTGGEIELRGFRMNPKTANASSLELTWPESHVLRRLSLRTINAEMHASSFLGRTLSGEELSAAQADMHLDFPVSGQPHAAQSSHSDAMDIRFQRYAAHKLQVTLGQEISPVLRLRDSEFTLQNQGRSGGAMLLINRGTLSIPGAPAWRVDRGHLDFDGEDIDVIGLRLLHATDNSGHMKFHGTVQPYNTGRESTLAVQVDGLPFDALVGEQLGEVLSGRVNSVDAARSNFFSFTPTEDTRAILAITFESTPATPFVVKGFPAFGLLARLLEDKWFENPAFENDVRGSLRRADGEVMIGDLECENRSRISLKANLRVTADGQLTGTLRMGIAESLLQSTRDPRLEKVFAESRHGFRWAEMAVSGRADAPLDNLSALYDAAPAGVDAALPGSRGTPSFQDLTTPE